MKSIAGHAGAIPNRPRIDPDAGTTIVGRDDIAERLDAAVHSTIAHQQAAEAAIEARNHLIAEAHDLYSWSTPELARKTNLSQTTIMRILAQV